MTTDGPFRGMSEGQSAIDHPNLNDTQEVLCRNNNNLNDILGRLREFRTRLCGSYPSPEVADGRTRSGEKVPEPGGLSAFSDRLRDEVDSYRSLIHHLEDELAKLEAELPG